MITMSGIRIRRTEEEGLSRYRLVAIPALVTLVVTLVRLFGELQHWSPTMFRRDPGGLGALVGIIWLAPIFGVYFALKLVKSGAGPASPGRAIAHAFMGVGVFLGWAALSLLLVQPGRDTVPRPAQFQVQVITGAAAALGVVILQMRGWAALCKTLLVYAASARVPVVIVMLLAIFGGWGTHYDAFPAGFPLTGAFEKWFWGGALVQMTVHLGNTVLLGSLFGSLGAAWVLRKRGSAEVA
jgi:hypothetical protein